MDIEMLDRFAQWVLPRMRLFFSRFYQFTLLRRGAGGSIATGWDW